MNGQSDFIAYADEVRPSIVGAIETHISGLFEDAPADILNAIIHGVGGGKCLRGALLCLVGEALGAERLQLISRAVAIECIHAATLVHDDLIDQDRYRRGQPAMWTLFGGREAILLGDVILAEAIRALAELGAAEARIGADAIAKLARGAYIESAFNGDGKMSSTAYPNIIHLKTGVLFAAAAELGAVSAGVGPAAQERAHRFGRLLGEAYQIADDLQALDHEALSPSFLPVICHFAPEWRQAAAELPLPAQDLLRQRMCDAAEERCTTASLLLADLPFIKYDHALQTAPRQTVGSQYAAIREALAPAPMPFAR